MRAGSARYQGFIFDVDGVLTDTAELHFAAWKRAFDEFLQSHAEPAAARPFAPEDFRRHVNGKPRHDGIRDFLRARAIELPPGSPEDAPGAASVYGLGNRKNEHLQALLQRLGARVYSQSVEFLRQVRLSGARTAAVSSSRNAGTVLERAGLSALFDVRIDGELAARLGLAGKPAPDYFLEAARRLELAPARCVVFEDALSGVRAGAAGGFGLVVGVAHAGAPSALQEAGADVVVEELGELDPAALPHRDQPLALTALPALTATLGRRLGIFLDYDGTLTPIVRRPEAAVLTVSMRATLAALARHCPVAIVSGRDLDDVRRRVALPQLYYVGSHGFDIAGPAGDPLRYRPAEAYAPALDAAEAELREPLAAVAGVQLERKRFSIAVHYRNVAPEDFPELDRTVDTVARAHPQLKRGTGKKVIELRPRVDWHKGKAVGWLLERLRLDGEDALALYIGDDVTDEDVFRALAGKGASIVVAEAPRASLADYRLRDVVEVEQLLAGLTDGLAQRGAHHG